MSNPGAVLLVEDETFTRRMMQIYFEKYNYIVEEAGNGQEALDVLRRKQVDLVVTDVMMPEMTGLELIQEIRKTHDLWQLPVMVLTSSEQTEKVMEALELGANDFVTKTKEFGILLARVQMLLERVRLNAELENRRSGHGLRSGRDGVWRWDFQKGAVYYSPTWKAILGFDRNQLDASPDSWMGRIHPDDFVRVSEGLRDHQNKKTACFEMDYRIQNKEGEYIWVHSFGVAMFDAKSQPIRMIGSMSRANRRHDIEQRRNQMKQQLDQLESAMEAWRNGTGDLGELFGHVNALRRGLDNLLQ
jgi:PAS domain S-box-containing protein